MDQQLAGGRRAFAIVPHASTNHPYTFSRIYVGGTGDVALVTADDSVVVFKAVPVGTWLYCESKRVNAVNTTATFLVGVR